MAYAALVSLAQTTNQILNHYQCSVFIDKKQQIITIHDFAIYFQAFLDDFPEKANCLEGRIRDVANEAEDLIQYFMLPHILKRYILLIRPTVEPKFKINYRPRYRHRPCDFGMMVEFSRKIDELEDVVEKMESIKSQLKIEENQKLGDSFAASSSSRLLPTSNHSMVGFDEDLMEIKEQLCGESSQLQIIPILGMGGIGKTTLARNAFNDPLIKESFDILAWVTVSQDYSAQEIMSQLLVSMEKFCAGFAKQDSEREKVYKSLKGRKYLIVMDDMWSAQAWDVVRNIFPNDRNGSRIMLTTRLSEVATYPNSSSQIHRMQFMDVDRSWDLLRQKIFANQGCPPELENIGKEIARSCKGLPLAIVVIGGLLSTVKKDPASWAEIAENVKSVVAGKDGQFEEILSLSYTHLPHYLKACFLYLGGFPEDHEVRVSKLIRLWVADGFLKHLNECKSLEEEAEECLENLIQRSLVLVTKRKSNGKIKSCSLHDLMRDLCIRKAHEEKFVLNFMYRYDEELASIESRKYQRRISIADNSTINAAFYRNIDVSTIRSIMCFHICHLPPSFKRFRLLRILDALGSRLESLPTQLFELFHLRFLGFKCWSRILIPAAIAKLENLQTLIILGSSTLPQQIWRMRQLRHLVFSGRLPNPEETTSALENLQTLSIGSAPLYSAGSLKIFPNMKILELSVLCNEDYTFLNSLVYLKCLECLKLRQLTGRAVLPRYDITFPRMLKELTLSDWILLGDKMTVVGSLPNLQVLKLKDCSCEGRAWETTEGEFAQLEFLQIENSDFEHWITESSHFPRLKSLLLHDCWRLRDIPEGVGEIETLELIEVKGSLSLQNSAKQIQEEQQSLGNYALQVRCMTFDKVHYRVNEWNDHSVNGDQSDYAKDWNEHDLAHFMKDMDMFV